MKVDIQNQEKNPFLNRVTVKGVITHEGESTPSGEELKGFLSKSLKEDEDKIKVKHIYTRKGMNISDFSALIGGVESVERKETEGEAKEKEESEEKEEVEEGEEEYEEILEGTISEGKEKINEMENPDFEKLLEIEKNKKDRKGMKSFLEGKIEG